MNEDYTVTTTVEQAEFPSGMVRDTAEGKIDYRIINYGPMRDRWVKHLDMARANYPDLGFGVPNWTVGDGIEEFDRFLESAERHFANWAAARRVELTEWTRQGHFTSIPSTEDEAAAVFFNMNGAENVRLLRRYDAAASEGFGPGAIVRVSPSDA